MSSVESQLLRASCDGDLKALIDTLQHDPRNLGECLYWAWKKGHTNIVQELIQRGANININILREACKCSRLDIVQMIVKHRAEYANLCLDEAAERGQLNIVKWLVNNGANYLPNAFWSAVMHSHIDVVMYFIDLGVRPSLSWLNNIILHGRWNVKIAICLLNNGCNASDLNSPYIEDLLNHGYTEFNNITPSQQKYIRRIKNVRQHRVHNTNSILKRITLIIPGWDINVNNIITDYIEY